MKWALFLSFAGLKAGTGDLPLWKWRGCLREVHTFGAEKSERTQAGPLGKGYQGHILWFIETCSKFLLTP